MPRTFGGRSVGNLRATEWSRGLPVFSWLGGGWRLFCRCRYRCCCHCYWRPNLSFILSLLLSRKQTSHEWHLQTIVVVVVLLKAVVVGFNCRLQSAPIPSSRFNGRESGRFRRVVLLRQPFRGENAAICKHSSEDIVTPAGRDDNDAS